MMDDGFLKRIATLDAARGRWKREAVRLAKHARELESGSKKLARLVAGKQAEIEQLSRQLRRSEQDLDPMRMAEARALDEVLRLQDLVDQLHRREVAQLVNVLDQVRRAR